MAWKFIQNQNTVASLLGLAWSRIRVRFKLEAPTMLQGRITTITNTSLGLTMYSPDYLSGGTAIVLSLAANFLLVPLLMAVLWLAFGLRGTTLNIAILQATLPLGIDPFVFAQVYGVHPNIMRIGVILGLLVAIPVVLFYNIVLEKL